MGYKPSISVIVPVYNVEKYIQRCIDSYKPPYGSGKLHIPGHTRTFLIYQGVAGFFVDK